jgi:hypothetical protein
MKNKLLIILFFLGILISDAGARPDVRIITGNPYDFRPTNLDAVIKAQVQITANNIATWVQNTGTFNQDIRTTNTPGFQWPKSEAKFAIFTTGLSIGTYINGNLRLGNASYNGEYAPGYVDQTVPTDPKFKTNSSFKLYKIVAGDNAQTNPDYANWGLMVPYGAPYVDVDGNQQFNPLVDRPGIKDAAQTIFVCLTDADPSNHTSSEGFSGGTLPIFAETHLTIWAYTSPGLEDLQFVNWVVINKSGRNWDSTHFGVVIDPDLGDANNDYIGHDKSRNMAFCYNATNTDPIYGTAPPASGMDFFRSPVIPDPTSNDTSYFPPGSENKVIKRGYRQLGLTSFVYFTNTGSGGIACEQDPQSVPLGAFNYLNGIKRDGTPWLDPTQNPPVITKYCYPGDPETGNGWWEGSPGAIIKNCGGLTSGTPENSPPGDRRMIFNSGAKNFTVAPGDTQNIVLAQFVAKGSNNKNSVTKLKGNSDIAQKVFDLNFKVIPPPPPPVVNVSYKPNSTIGTVDVTFSWGDVSEQYNFKDELFNQGTYKFQGYEIYEIKKSASQLPDFTRPETITSDVTLIDAFDLRDTIGIVVDTFKTNVVVNGQEQVGPFPIMPPYKMNVPAGFPNKGLQRSITLNGTQYSAEYGGRDKFIVGNEYKFAIVAYGVCAPLSYDSVTRKSSVLRGGKLIRNSLSTQLITIRPEAPTAGTDYFYANGDTITTNRKDLGVIPKVVDQTKLLNAKYRVSFRTGDTTYNILRSLNGGTSFDTLKKVNEKDSKFGSGFDSTAKVLNLKFTRNRTGGTDSARVVDGLLINVVRIRTKEGTSPNNEGVLKDVSATRSPDSIQTRLPGWEYSPSNNNWLTGSKFVISDDKKWQSLSMSLTYPTALTYTGLGSSYKSDSLKKVRIVFQTDENSGQLAYRFVATGGTDPNYVADPSYDPYIINKQIGYIYQDRRKVPFKVFEVDPLTNAEVRQLNCAFVENNDVRPIGLVDGKWMPQSDTSGSGERLYIFGSTYSESDLTQYTSLTAFANNLYVRQGTTDIMYIWAPRSINASSKWTAGDQFTIYPYTVTRPGVVYEFDSRQPLIGSTTVASEKGALNDIRVVPNPYYGYNVNEKSSTQRFVTFRKLPINVTIRIYTLNGDLVKKLVKNDQNSTMNWDLKNLDDIPVASGLYLALIDAPGIGQKTMKLAIFTPEERVDF